MGMFHFLKRKVDYRARAAWSKKPSGKAIIFVHGFNGSAHSTWSDFYGLHSNYTEFQGYDLIFYEYDSIYLQANTSALNFLHFLKGLYNDTYYMVKAGFQLPRSEGQALSPEEFTGFAHQPNFKYSKIVIVAHSLGAVITRKALLMAKKDSEPWIDRAEMILFAPAHLGARAINHLRALMFPWPLKVLSALIDFKAAAIDDLLPESAVIQSLKEESREWEKKNEHHFTIAKAVVWAERELIVHNDTFLFDPTPDQFPGTTHITVCKPSGTFLLPIEKIIEFI